MTADTWTDASVTCQHNAGGGDAHQALCDWQTLLNQMCSVDKLQRDRSGALLRDCLLRCADWSPRPLVRQCVDTVTATPPPTDWRALHGSLTALCVVVEVRGGSALPDDGTCASVLHCCRSLLAHSEARVRVVVGELLGSLCAERAGLVYDAVHQSLFSLITENMHADTQLGDDSDTASVDVGSGDSSEVFACTASWTVLETCLKCLRHLLMPATLPVNRDMVDVVLPCSRHSNRFVREAMFACVAAFLSDQVEIASDIGDVDQFGNVICSAIANGMDDNWSQVRMSASVACRRLLCGCSCVSLSAGDCQRRSAYLALLVPRLCLNRYYVAEGVKIYNQKTWEQLADSRGCQIVEKHMPQVVDFYVCSMRAENHAVREAACYCTRELVAKTGADAVRAHVDRLLHALLGCFHDDSWPVRDTACLAAGGLVAQFGDASAPYMPQLYPLMMANLFDNIASVRQGGAETLARVASVFGDSCLTEISKRVEDGLSGVRAQCVETGDDDGQLEPVMAGGSQGGGGGGVVRRQHASASQLRHTDQTMYSCGSLAPKMRAVGGCSAGHHFRRAAQPWEIADGCVRLLCCLASVAACRAFVLRSLPLVSAAVAHRHYQRHVQLVETVCRSLPPLAQALGRRDFKTHLELFLDVIFYAVNSDTQLTADSGVSCVQQLSKLIGPGIFRGRVQMHNPSFVAVLDRLAL